MNEAEPRYGLRIRSSANNVPILAGPVRGQTRRRARGRARRGRDEAQLITSEGDQTRTTQNHNEEVQSDRSESPSPTMAASTQLQSELTAIEEIEYQCINYDAASSPLSDLPESTSPKRSELDELQFSSVNPCNTGTEFGQEEDSHSQIVASDPAPDPVSSVIQDNHCTGVSTSSNETHVPDTTGPIQQVIDVPVEPLPNIAQEHQHAVLPSWLLMQLQHKHLRSSQRPASAPTVALLDPVTNPGSILHTSVQIPEATPAITEHSLQQNQRPSDYLASRFPDFHREIAILMQLSNSQKSLTGYRSIRHYIILNSTTRDLGLSINTRQTDNAIYPSPGMILRLSDLYEWVGVNSGTFYNKKNDLALICKYLDALQDAAAQPGILPALKDISHLWLPFLRSAEYWVMHLPHPESLKWKLTEMMIHLPRLGNLLEANSM